MRKKEVLHEKYYKIAGIWIYKVFIMKKLLLILLFINLTLSVFSQEQILIGDRIVYSKNYGIINIFDAIDKQEYRIYFRNVIENIYDINNRHGQRLITIDIYTDEITLFLIKVLDRGVQAMD
ncbi:MAG: hypothetical protein FWC01_04875 [Treponema sp.]|nr:hypothetical protein [Treponema sp.]